VHKATATACCGACDPGWPPDALRDTHASQQLGGALGLAIFAAIATSHTSHLLAAHTAMPAALTAGFQRALLASSVFLVVAAVIATRTSHTRGEPDQDVLELQPQPEIRTGVAP
jgi:hypothetical protein